MTPALTVVIPTRGRSAALRRCLGALAQVEPPPGGFEVVVVDDGSLAPEATIDEPAPALDLTALATGGAGPAAARNAGAASARGELLAFTDDDCLVPATWLVDLAAAAEGHPGAIVAGHCRPGPGPCVRASEAVLAAARSRQTRDGVPFVVSNNLAVPRAVFDRLGGFDVRFVRAAGEDRDFGLRAAAAGVEIVDAPTIAVTHHADPSVNAFVRRHAAYGRATAQLRRRHGSGVAQAGAARSAAVVRDAIARTHGPYEAALVGLSQAAHLAGFAYDTLAVSGGSHTRRLA